MKNGKKPRKISKKVKTMNQEINITELEKLTKRWKKRINKLSQQSSGLGKINTVANAEHSNKLFGRFCELEKCRKELVSIKNKIGKGL